MERSAFIVRCLITGLWIINRRLYLQKHVVLFGTRLTGYPRKHGNIKTDLLFLEELNDLRRIAALERITEPSSSELITPLNSQPGANAKLKRQLSRVGQTGKNSRSRSSSSQRKPAQWLKGWPCINKCAATSEHEKRECCPRFMSPRGIS
jgi:hypothetical protein